MVATLLKTMINQLTLGIRLHDEANFESFFTGENKEVIAALKKLVHDPGWNYVYIYGENGVGKSHLLQACCQLASRHNLTSFYLPLSREVSPTILEGLDNFSLVCIDDIQESASNSLWEESLFHFYNQGTLSKMRLLIAGSSLPQQLPFRLPDLISRLNAGITYHLKDLSDTQKLMTMQLRAQIRGFELSDEVGKYLLNHFPRGMGALLELLEKLDQVSLQAKQKITIPLIKHYFQAK
jgi:DnaA family protein